MIANGEELITIDDTGIIRVYNRIDESNKLKLSRSNSKKFSSPNTTSSPKK